MIDREIVGTKWISWGTYTNSGSTTGGELDTGLKVVESAHLTPTGSSVDASAPTIDESFPFIGGTITVVTVAGGDGVWFALGRM